MCDRPFKTEERWAPRNQMHLFIFTQLYYYCTISTVDRIIGPPDKFCQQFIVNFILEPDRLAFYDWLLSFRIAFVRRREFEIFEKRNPNCQYEKKKVQFLFLIQTSKYIAHITPCSSINTRPVFKGS